MESFKLYFPFVIQYDNSLRILSQCNPEEIASMVNIDDFSDGELIAMYSEPYHRLEVYCSLFQVPARACSYVLPYYIYIPIQKCQGCDNLARDCMAVTRLLSYHCAIVVDNY